MRRFGVLLVVLIVAAVAALVATRFLDKPAPPPPLIPSASPTPDSITTVGDLYRAEAELNNLNVDAADDPYKKAIEGASAPVQTRP